MKKILVFMILLSSILVFSSAKEQEKVNIEVVFVLDTTGSMSGLIEGAKRKIWSIANEIAKAKPVPELKIGLVPYRDAGDAYVTKVFDLSENLDEVFKNLMSFSANGGGDMPEHVNKALYEAANKISWSKDKKTLKIIFLVGDAPPHMDYKDGYDYHEICKKAIEKDIMINTVRCGNITETEAPWQEIARLSDGSYTSIGQSGDMNSVSTPYDSEISMLNAEIGSTRIAYGTASMKDKLKDAEREEKSMVKCAEALGSAASADRAVYKADKAAGRFSEYDLLDALESGKADLGKLKKEEFSDVMKNMSVKEQKEYIENAKAKRKEIKEKIEKLAKKRSEYIKNETAKIGKTSFDEIVIKTIKKLAEKKGIKFE